MVDPKNLEKIWEMVAYKKVLQSLQNSIYWLETNQEEA